jgi:predicted Rdx family selenoprotein
VSKIAVEYCTSRRIGTDAAQIRRVLSDRLRGHDEVDAVLLSPSPHEVFCVSIDDERVWCVDPGDRIDPMEAVAAVRSRLYI